MTPRDNINPNHPIIGDNYLLLEDDSILQSGDQTTTISTMLTLDGDKWYDLSQEDIGKTVAEVLENDADASERIFRRKFK